MKKSVLFMLLVFCALAFLSASALAGEYLVVSKIAPILSEPGMKYEGDEESVRAGDNVEGVVVYGNIVTAEPAGGEFAKDWLRIIDEGGEQLGFTLRKDLHEIPTFEKMQPEKYWVRNDDTQLFILPGSEPISKQYGGITLLRGMAVTALGSLKKDGGEWILLTFGSYDVVSVGGAFEGSEPASSGVGARYAWGKAADFVRLSDYSPDNSKVDENLLPNTVIDKQRSDEHEKTKIEGETRARLMKNGFFINPEPIIDKNLEKDDMVDLYTNMGRLTPKFITADFTLHVFHLLFDRMLQKAEISHFAPALDALLADMLANLKGGDEVSNLVREYLSVAKSLLAGDEAMKDNEEYKKIMRAEGMGISSLTGKEEDYTFYKPRGHYTLSPELERYFRATAFLGGTSFYLNFPDNPKKELFNTAVISKLCSLIDNEKTLAAWKKVFDPFSMLIGASNDNSWYDFNPIVKKFGNELSDEAKLGELRKALLEAARKPLVIGKAAPRLNATQEEREEDAVAFRFIGRRFTFDAFVLNMLSSPNVGTPEKPRNLPSPLDVMAVLGSSAAMEQVKPFSEYENYSKNLDELTQKWKEFDNDPLSKNIYTKWLQMYSAYFTPGESTQFFCNTKAWQYKKLMTASASYAELKHDTVLYGEQSGAESGGGDDYWTAAPFEFPKPVGYVEPATQVFKTLAACSEELKSFLEAAGIKDEEYDEKITDFASVISRLAEISELQKSGKLSNEDVDFIREDFWYELPSVLPKGYEFMYGEGVQDGLRMGLVSDIATDFNAGEALYVATGAPMLVRVFVNDGNGGARVASGYVFSYYTFAKTISEGRMDDKQWKETVYDSAKQKELSELRPDWFKNVLE